MTLSTEITSLSKGGQIVIPQRIRDSLKIKPGSKFAIYIKNDLIIMKLLDLPDPKKEWSEAFRNANKKHLKMDEKEVLREVQSHRIAKRRLR